MSEGPERLWGRIERLLPRVERPARYIDSEWGAVRDRVASHRTVLVFPDTYEIGQANQGLAILYDRLNAHDGFAAERAYVPWTDMAAAMRAEGIPLFSLETVTPLAEFDIIGITLPYELTYTNILEVLDLAGLPLYASERDDTHPLVIGGGPCAYNPEPIAPFFDAVLIGEGEQAVFEIAQLHHESRDAGSTRAETLSRLATLPGVYVPALYDVTPGSPARPHAPAPEVVTRRIVPDLSDYPPPACSIVPFMDVVHDRVSVEVLRGCTRGCRFCQAGMVYRPVRERRADDIVREVMAGLRCTGYDEVSLTSLSTTDHSQLEEVVRRLTTRLASSGVTVSLPSLRVDAFSVEMARLVSAGRRSGLTLAPEAGTQRLRDAINKNVTEEELLTTVEHAFRAGWRRVKLYFMIGLPTETDDDVSGIGQLVGRVQQVARAAVEPSDRGSVRIAVSVSTLVPKAHTPFQWMGQIPHAEIVRRQDLLRAAMPRKGVDLSWHDAEVSFLEAVMARGGRELAPVIEAAWRAGSTFDSWTERFDLATWRAAFASAGIDAEAIATHDFADEDPLPWAHLSSGVSHAYLLRERDRTYEGAPTADCSFDDCTGCGVCGELDVDIVLGGAARGSR